MNENTNSASRSVPPGSGVDSVSKEVDWETRYQLGETPWDKGIAAPPLVDFLEYRSIYGEILVPGCGSGHDVRALAAQGNTVMGFDVAESAIIQARSHSPVGNETYELGDLFALPSSWYERFHWVVEHTCFCAISPDRRPDYVKAVAQVLKPGGFFFGIFFITPDVEQGPPFGVSREEIATLFDPHFELLNEWIPSQSYAGREGRELCQLRRRKLSE